MWEPPGYAYSNVSPSGESAGAGGLDVEEVPLGEQGLAYGAGSAPYSDRNGTAR